MKLVDMDGYWVLVDCLWFWGILKVNVQLDNWVKEIGLLIMLCKWFNYELVKYFEFVDCYWVELDENFLMVSFIS